MLKAYIDAIKKWNRWDGRTCRRDYWLFTIMNTIITYALAGVMLAFYYLELDTLFFISTALLIIYAILIAIPSISILIRRLHDTNRSGGFYFIQLIPYVGEIWLFVLTLLPGTVGYNNYGPDPNNNDLDPRDEFIPQSDALSFGEYPDFRGDR